MTSICFLAVFTFNSIKTYWLNWFNSCGVATSNNFNTIVFNSSTCSVNINSSQFNVLSKLFQHFLFNRNSRVFFSQLFWHFTYACIHVGLVLKFFNHFNILFMMVMWNHQNLWWPNFHGFQRPHSPMVLHS